MKLQREEKIPAGKFTVMQYVIVGIFVLLGSGFWRLQVIGSERWETLAQQNRIRVFPILAPRGKLLDRDGRIIVDNYPSFSALLVRENAQNMETKIPQIAAGLNIPADEIKQRLRQFTGRAKYEPIIIKQDITPDELAFIEAHKSEIPELETIMVHR